MKCVFIIYMSIMLLCIHDRNGVSASEPRAEACTCSGLICKARPQRRYFPEEDSDEGEHVEINVTPRRISKSDVEFDLYTRNNRDSPKLITNVDVTQLRNSNFDPKKISIFVCHGWTGSRSAPLNSNITSALFDGNYDVNVFVIDWSGHAESVFYVSPAQSAAGIGQVVGVFINSIQSTYGINGSSFVLIGFSLGAHVVGSAGATVKSKVANIIGLDPAKPLFDLGNLLKRLDSSDAHFVQVIHTSAQVLGPGYTSSIGDVDYFVNGGLSQPGCRVLDVLDIGGVCSHYRAWMYLAEALRRGPVFRGVLCTDYETFKKGRCANNQQSIMGEIIVTTKVYGDYYLDTNSKEPFGLS